MNAAVEGAWVPFETTLIFDWPTLPLSMNDRLHRRQHQQVNASIRDATELAAELLPDLGRCKVTLVQVVTDRIRRDGINANATLKPMQDGLVRAGVVRDDTEQYMFSPQPVIEWRDKKAGHTPHFELHIERLPTTEASQ